MADTCILVVDDEESVATTIEAILRLDGHDVVAVTAGRDAIRLLNERQFDVVLTDLRLNDIDGIEVLREVQRTGPETAAIMLTGYASLESAVAALRAGAYDYLMKPSDVDELRATVNRAIERRLLRRRLLELEEVDRLKTQFLSMASHELRTPLTAVSGFIQVARRRIQRAAEHLDGVDWKEESRRAVETLELAQRQSRRLARLVDELLDVSRLQLGRAELRLQEVDLIRTLRELVERMRLLTTTHTFELVTDADAVAVVRADPDRIDQVFENLIGNAVKYSPTGSTVTIAARTIDGDVRVAITDQGIGISREELDRIFNLFYRSPDPRAGHVGGLGLGLYISREIVTRHEGRLWAESSAEHGSTFHVIMPLAKPATAVTGPAEGSTV